MKDILECKRKILEFQKQGHYKTKIYYTDLLPILEALSEAKEIIENLKETSRTYAMQTYSKVAHKSADTADEWLSRFFPDTRKEEV